MQDWEDLVVMEEEVEVEEDQEEDQDSLVVLVYLGQTISQVPMAYLLLMVESCGL